MAAKITKVDKNSVAESYGIIVGDTLISIDGSLISDVLDFKFYSYDEEIDLVIERNGEKIEFFIDKEEGEDLGIEFETYLMDSKKSCANKCIFCFIDQNPKNMRETIYFKDDDARLSFLLGNYISLTNLSERDVNRMIRMRMSPLNISVQTTNPKLRDLMLGNKRGGVSLSILDKFHEANIEMNFQLVVCEGINDGEELRRSLYDLKKYMPNVTSISVVPAGITKHRDGLYNLSQVSKENAKDIIEITEKFAKECFDEFGTSVAFCGDELYLKAEKEFPKVSYYEEFYQFENGVGMISLFREQFLSKINEFSGKTTSFTIATGAAAFNLLNELVNILKENDKNINANVIKVENKFYGESVSVSGLITGGDLINSLKTQNINDRILITKNMIRDGGDVFLDDLTIEDVEKALGKPVFTVENDGFELLNEIYRK